MEQLEVCKVATYIPIEKLKFHPQNEIRTITRDRLDDLKESIRLKGFYEPILVWKKGGVVLAGEHRTRAARELIEDGYEFVTPSGKKNHLPIVLEDCDEHTAVQILHESNNHYASWIEEKLSKAIQEAEKAGENIRQFGYSQEEIDRLLVTATKDIEKITAASTEIMETPEPAIGDAIEKEKFETLVLPAEVYSELMGILAKVAILLDPNWTRGDSVIEATKALCETIREAKVLENLEEDGD